MTGEERQKDFQKVVKMAQDRILDFLETYSDSETLKKARSTFAQHPVMLSEHETQRDELSGRDESASGVAGKDTITIDDSMFVSSSTNNHHELDGLLGLIIHEYAHEFRKDNDTNYQKSFEESAVSLFSEMCINHANAKSIGSAAELFQNQDVFDYKYSQNELRAILYVLKQHNLDVTLLTKYVFGDEIDFVKKCCEIFGDKFLDYFNEAIGKRTDQKQDSKSQDMLNDIMKDYISNNKLSFKDYEAKKDASTLYNPTSSVIARSVTELGDSALLDDEKEYYEYFAYDNKFYNDILNDSNNSARERIVNLINTRYSLEGKNPEQIYDTLVDLVSDYNSYRSRTDDYGRTYITELRARIPNIDEIALNFTQTRVDGLRSEMFATIAPRGISYNVVGQTLRQYVPGGSARVNVGGTINTTATVSGTVRNVARGVAGTASVGVGVAGATIRAAQAPSSVNVSTTVNENINARSTVDVTREVTQNVTSTDTVTTTTTTSTVPGSATTTTVDSVSPAASTVAATGAASIPSTGQTVTSTPGGGVSTITPGQSERGRVRQGQNIDSNQVRPDETPTNQEGQASGEPVQGNQEQPINEVNPDEQPVDNNEYTDQGENQNLEEPTNKQESQEGENPEETSEQTEGNKNAEAGEEESTEGEEEHAEGQQPVEGENPEEGKNPEKQNQNPNAENKDENKPESDEDDFNDAVNRNNHNQRLNNQNNLPEEEGPNKYRKNNNFNQRQNAANAAEAADKAKDGADAAKKGADAAKTADAAKKGADAAKKAEAAKKGAEAAKTAEAAGAAKAGEKGILAFFKTYPWVALIIIVVIILIIIILTVIITFELDKELKDLNGEKVEANNNITEKEYINNNYQSYITIKDSNGKTQNVDIDDYIAGVLAKEVGEFSDSPEMLKVQAIAARSYALNRMDANGSIGNSSNAQNYSSDASFTKDDSPFMIAARETSGLILTSSESADNKAYFAQYDALAVNSSCGGSVTSEYYTICQKQLKIPVSWASENGLTSSDLAFYQKYYHGQGMSQWGAYYLAKGKNQNYEQILNYFYDKADIKTIKAKPVTAAATPTVTPNSGIINERIDTFLSHRGYSASQFNNLILKSVLKAGPGTGDAVASVATTFLGTMDSQFSARIPYAWAGGQGQNYKSITGEQQEFPLLSYYGINEHFGEPAYVGGVCYKGKYCYYGLDCAGFVTWAIHNAGIDIPGNMSTWSYVNIGEVIPIKKVTEASPGDILLSDANHIMLVLSYNDSTKTFRVAHASGWQNGMYITDMTIDNIYNQHSDYTLHRMESWYNEHKTSNYEAKFQSGRRV